MVENPPSNAGDVGLIPGQGTKILTCHEATKPVASQLLSTRATTTEPSGSRACTLQLERSLCNATKDPTFRKERPTELRPDAAKNKITFFLKMEKKTIKIK